MRAIVATTPEKLSSALAALHRDWDEIREDALTGAILFGGFTEDVIKRTPKSEYRRYKHFYGEEIARRKGYGMQRLLKSLLKSGRPDMKTDFVYERRAGMMSMAISSDVKYAYNVHEGIGMPGEGSYWNWDWKSNYGWSTEGTGIKFLEYPWDDNQFRTEDQLLKNIDAQLKERGLL